MKEAVLPPPVLAMALLVVPPPPALLLLELEAAGAGAVEEDAIGAAAAEEDATSPLTWARLFEPLPTCCAALLELFWPGCPVLPEPTCGLTFCCPLVWPLCCPVVWSPVWPAGLPFAPETGATEELCAGDDDTAFGAGTTTGAPPCCWTAPLVPDDPPCLWRALQVPA